MYCFTCQAEGIRPHRTPREKGTLPMTHTPAPQPLKVSNPGDLLALATNCYGYTPENSLIIIGLNAGKTGAHLRVDLAPGLTEAKSITTQYARHFGDHHEACAVLMTGPYAPAPGYMGHPSSESNALAVIDEALAAVGAPVIAAWQYGEGYAYDLQNPAATYPGEIYSMNSPAAKNLLPAQQVTPQDTVKRYSRRAPDPTLEKAIHAATASPSEGLQIWDAVLTGELTPENLTAPEMAGMLASLAGHGAKAVIATATAGPAAGHDIITRPHTPGLPAVANTTGPAPDWARIDRLADALAVLVPYAPLQSGADLFAVMAWVSFAKGSTSTKVLFEKRAESLNENAPLLVALKSYPADALAGWAQHPETAYSGQ